MTEEERLEAMSKAAFEAMAGNFTGLGYAWSNQTEAFKTDWRKAMLEGLAARDQFAPSPEAARERVRVAAARLSKAEAAKQRAGADAGWRSTDIDYLEAQAEYERATGAYSKAAAAYAALPYPEDAE